jgi:hypothetical protein
VVGFTDVLIVNFCDSLLSFDFTLLGEDFVIAAFVLSAAGTYGKRVSQEVDSVVLTGLAACLGRLALLLSGLATGGPRYADGISTWTPERYIVPINSALGATRNVLDCISDGSGNQRDPSRQPASTVVGSAHSAGPFCTSPFLLP